MNNINLYTINMSIYIPNKSSLGGGGQSLGKFKPSFALVNNDIKNNEV